MCIGETHSTEKYQRSKSADAVKGNQYQSKQSMHSIAAGSDRINYSIQDYIYSILLCNTERQCN